MHPFKPSVPILFASSSAGRSQPDAKAGLAARLGITLAVVVPLLAPGMISAQTITNPPLMPQEIVVFPERDFISATGFAPNADVQVQLRRPGGAGNRNANGRTDATGFLEVNHPGGVCWLVETPDVVPADTVRVIYRETTHNRINNAGTVVIGTGAATTTQNVIATQAFDAGNGTVVIKGKAVRGNGRIPLNQLEVRIINPDFIDDPRAIPPPANPSRIGRREIRADSGGGRVDGADGNPIPGTSGTLAYDGAAPINTFTAVFIGLTAEERRRTVEGQTRAMAWQQTNGAGDRLGMTIYEAGEFGGPGMGSCPPGPNGPGVPQSPTAPVYYIPGNLPDAEVQANQGMLRDVTVFPERDFISIAGFPAGADLQVVVRRGTSDKPVIGTARGKVGSGGIFEVNHPGGVCWSGQTPDIKAGDSIDVIKLDSSGYFNEGQTQRVIDAKIIGKPVINATTGDLRINGSAVDAAGAPLPLQFVEQRIIQPDFKDTRIGRRDIRADTSGGRVENVPGGSGRLLRTTSTTVGEWRAIYTGLTPAERTLAIAGQSRAMAWLSTNGNGDRFGMTIFEFGETGGPGMGGCPPHGTAQIGIR